MRIVCLGGGPAGLYFAILAKKAQPAWHVTVVERNRANDTFGWGVVFSDKTMDAFRKEDTKVVDEIERSFRALGRHRRHLQGAKITSGGHGFCGIARMKLLEVLQQRAAELGVELKFETEFDDPDEYAKRFDLVVGADGVTPSRGRSYAQHFNPRIDVAQCRFIWLGTRKKLDAFTFVVQGDAGRLVQPARVPLRRGVVDVHRRDAARPPGRRPASTRCSRRSPSRSARSCSRIPGRSPADLQRAPPARLGDVAQVQPRALRALVQGQHRPHRRCGAHRALLDRLRHQARHGGCDLALPRHPQHGGGRPREARALPVGARGRGAQAPERRAQPDGCGSRTSTATSTSSRSSSRSRCSPGASGWATRT